MKNEIIKKVLSIPLSEWSGYKTSINGVEVILEPMHTNYSPHIMIEGITFHGKEIYDLKNRLDILRKEKTENELEAKLKDIYSRLFV